MRSVFHPAEMTMPVPNEAEWGNYHADLDQKSAHDLFAGQTNQEMVPHFRRNVIERTDELRWMPEVPFRYHVLGFRDLILQEQFHSDWAPDAASCFIGLVLMKLETNPSQICPVMPDLLPALRHLAQNQVSLGASESIYGKFQEKLSRIEAAYSQYSAT